MFDKGLAYPTARQAGFTLAITLVAYILSFVDRQIMTLMVGPIRKDLAITDFQMGLLHGLAFALFYCFLGIPIGRLADLKSRKHIIAIGIAVWSVMTAVCGLARSYTTLFLARMGVGVGEATLSPATYSLLSDSFPPERLTRAMAIYTMGITLGTGLAYIVGGSVVALVSQAGEQVLPLVGTVRPWQLAFFIVGLPGLVIAATVLLIREPVRRGLASAGEGAKQELPLGTVLRYLRQRWSRYLPIYLLNACFAIVGYGAFSWYPTMLMRNYGLSPGSVGLHFGLIVLIAGTLGTFCGALLTERLARRYTDAHLRAVMLIAVAAVIPAAIAPQMGSYALSLLLVTPAMFLLNSYFSVSVTALQLVTPNQMRAVNSSLLLLTSNIIGLGFGTPLIGYLTDHVFGDDQALRYSLLTITLIFLPLAALSAALGMRPFRAGLEESRTWDAR